MERNLWALIKCVDRLAREMRRGIGITLPKIFAVVRRHAALCKQKGTRHHPHIRIVRKYIHLSLLWRYIKKGGISQYYLVIGNGRDDTTSQGFTQNKVKRYVDNVCGDTIYERVDDMLILPARHLNIEKHRKLFSKLPLYTLQWLTCYCIHLNRKGGGRDSNIQCSICSYSLPRRYFRGPFLADTSSIECSLFAIYHLV